MNTLTIKSYILTKMVRDLEDLERNPKDYLLGLHEQSEEALTFLHRQSHNKEMDGVITITFNGKEIIGYTYWDTIDVQWSYLLNLVEDYLMTGEGVGSYPEMPIEIILREEGRNNVSFIIDNKRIYIERELLLDTILKEASRFFQFLTKAGFGYGHVELERIEKMNKLRNAMKYAT